MLEAIGPALLRVRAGRDQRGDDRRIGFRGREIERRVAAAVLGRRIRRRARAAAGPLRAVLEHRKMQRRAMVLEAAHLARCATAPDRRRRAGAPGRRDRARPPRRSSAWRRAPADSRRPRGAPAEARRPADHADLVRVAFAVDVGAGLDQALDHCERSELRGPVQRGRIVEPVARRDVEAAPQQHVDAIEVTFAGRDVQQRPVPVAAGDGDLARMLREKSVESPRAWPSVAAAMICPSRLCASTCAFSARQLGKP